MEKNVYITNLCQTESIGSMCAYFDFVANTCKFKLKRFQLPTELAFGRTEEMDELTNEQTANNLILDLVQQQLLQKHI